MVLPEEFKEALDQSFNWQLTNVPELEGCVLIVLEYSPSSDQHPVSIAFDCAGAAKCWLSASKLKKINEIGPDPCEDYRQFSFEGRKFYPYSIKAFPRSIFENMQDFTSACQALYQHVDWS